MSKKVTRLLVPECDLCLPLAQRRFPYRAAPAVQVGEARAQKERCEANEAISLALASVRGMVRRLIIESSTWRPQHEVEDLTADTMAHLCIDSLPRYDRHKGNKVSTFLYSCACRYIFRNAPKRGLDTESLHDVTHDCRADLRPPALISTDDPDISHALRIIRRPEKHLNPVQARVISEYTNGVPIGTIAQHVTKSRSSVRRIFRSACARIRKISESSELPEYAT